MFKYNHYCVPVKAIPKTAQLVEQLGVYVTDFNDDPFNIEYLYVPEDNKIVPKELRTHNHLAFDTNEFDKVLKITNSLYEFICPVDNKSRMAFVEYNGAILEIKEVK